MADMGNMPVAVAVDAPPAQGAGAAPPAGMGSYQLYVKDAEKAVRMGFTRKVFAIFTVQLIVTFGITMLFSIGDCPANQQCQCSIDPEGHLFCGWQNPVKNYVRTNIWVYYTGLGVSLAALFAIICCQKNARTFPRNYILLALFTLAESVMIGVISSYYDADVVALAIGMTVGVTLCLVLFACQTRIDFTGWGAYLYAGLMCLLWFGFFSIFFFGQIANLALGALGVLIFSMYLVYDTQLVIGGRHKKFQFGVDDYVFAALSLYLDVINLFLCILALLGGSNRR